MQYRICHISYGSAIKTSLLIGWLVALLPALCLAAIGVRALQQVNGAVSQIQPYEITVLGQRLARFDALQELQLADAAHTVQQLTANPTATFLRWTLVLTLAGAALVLAATLLFCLGYNIIAALGGGLAVEIEDEPR
ncbi:MAG TPA: hypothetical protein VFT66_13780 [Roseiflexaceae bacterium]|jgi:hypothetical protein|nr:hypothetical protein [Roseiflexaceae bacterium]